MDIYTYLKADHRIVADLMEQVISTNVPAERKALFEQIREQLTLHSDTEEVTFYKALREATQSENVQEKMEQADEEHNEIRDYLETLDTIPVQDTEWMEQFGEFKHAVTHHVQEEETYVFEKARQYLDDKQAKDLAVQMDALKKRIADQLHHAA